MTDLNLQRKALSPNEVATFYGIPEGSLANMRCQGVGPVYYKMGRRVRYFINDLEAWIKANPVINERRGRL